MRSNLILGLLAWLAFIVYGSLVPLDYRPIPLDRALRAFADIPFLRLDVGSRADWVANGVLYVPLGWLAARLAGARHGSAIQPLALVIAWMGCALVAVAVEFAQLAFPPRTVSQNDLIAEFIGSALGCLLAPLFAGRFDRFATAWREGGRRLWPHLLQAWALAYVVLAFFPYDLLLSSQELADKAASESWGWFMAPPSRGLFIALLQLVVEAAVCLPIGILVAQRRGSDGGGPRLSRAVAVGLALGLMIEIGQLFIASGVSQGASVVSRMLGVAAGAALAPALAVGGAGALRSLLRRLAPLWLPLYLPLLLFVNGWFIDPWQGTAAAAQTWAETRLLPFYYHYYTSEAVALFSLGSVVLMYLPVAALGWALGWRTATTVAVTAGVALVVEAGKLFIVDRHPDPTNLLIVAAANTAALWLAAFLSKPQQRPVMRAVVSTAPAHPEPLARRSPPIQSAVVPGPAHGWAGLLLLPLVGFWALHFPAFGLPILLLLAMCAAAVWWRPVLLLALVPALLPVLDFAPWSGRFYWDEFDLLLTAGLAVAFHRAAAPSRAADSSGGPATGLAFGLLGMSLVISTAAAMLPWQPIDANSFVSYHSPWNALRIVKGALWAWLFVLLWRRLGVEAGQRAFAGGVQVGLALTVLCIVWERLAFVGLGDFAADYRVTGPISAMHKGGAYIECLLAVGAAFTLDGLLRARTAMGRTAGVALLAGACYALMVTYSRNGYLALAVAAAIVLGGALFQPAMGPRARWRRLAAVGGLVSLIVAIVAPVALGSFSRERLAQSGRDLGVRQAHWADALQLRDDGVFTALFGMGLGRFPEAHFWRSLEPVHAGSYRLVREGGNTLLRLGSGATLYVEQIVDASPGETLVLKLDLRSKTAPAKLAVALCEKWMLTSKNCRFAEAVAAEGPAGAWREAEVRLEVQRSTDLGALPRPPLKLALLSPPSSVVVDVDNVRLLGADGESRLANGDFSAGLDRWFFSTDIDPPWHIHSLPLAVLFDQGWFGVLAWAAVLVVALAGVSRRWRSQPGAPLAAPAALAAFLVSGSLNTLIDAPRLLFLLLLLLWLCAVDTRPAARGDERGGLRRTSTGLARTGTAG